jgi:hypothetical protein
MSSCIRPSPFLCDYSSIGTLSPQFGPIPAEIHPKSPPSTLSLVSFTLFS